MYFKEILKGSRSKTIGNSFSFTKTGPESIIDIVENDQLHVTIWHKNL